MMHRTGRYKTLTITFGILPTLAAVLLARLQKDSWAITQWLSIIPLGFGNAVVLQSTLIALLASIPHSMLAVGTGFTQLFRGIGQVSGVAVSSAVFQHLLERELQKRLTGPGSEELIRKIRHDSRLVASLPEETQVLAREAYDIGLRAVFWLTAGAAFTGWCLRLALPEFSLDRPRDGDPQEQHDRRKDTNIAHAANAEPDEEMDRGLHDLDSSGSELFEEDDEMEWGTLKPPKPLSVGRDRGSAENPGYSPARTEPKNLQPLRPMAEDPAATSSSSQTPCQTDLLIRSLSTALSLFCPNSGSKTRHHRSGRYDQFDRMSLFFVSGATGDVAAMTALVEDNYVTFQTVQAESDTGRLAIIKNPDHRIDENSEAPRDVFQETPDEPAQVCLKWGPKSISSKAHGATLERLIRSLYQTDSPDQAEIATRVLRRYIYSFCFDKIMRRFNSKVSGYQARFTSLFLSDDITLENYRGSSPKEVVLPRRLASSDESTLKIALEAMYPNRHFKLSDTQPHRLILDVEDQWAVWSCFKRCLSNLQTALTEIRNLKSKRERMKEKDLDSALQHLDEVEEDMGIMFLLAHHSPSFWIVMERMAPLLERRLAPETGGRHDNTFNYDQTTTRSETQGSVELYPLSTNNTNSNLSSRSSTTSVDGDDLEEFDDDDDATSDVETTRQSRSARKAELPEDLHEVIAKS
ncbi:hypothetical protein FRC01_009670, partial [Tulasnella sp. 417]